jgi:hypothetical protein
MPANSKLWLRAVSLPALAGGLIAIDPRGSWSSNAPAEPASAATSVLSR